MSLPLFRLSVLIFLTLLGLGVVRGAEIDLYVLAGQSNMYGYQGNANSYPEDPEGLDRKVRFFKDGEWMNLQPQEGRFPKGHFGPEVTFARELVKGGGNVAIFKYSAGSTSITRDWKAPGAGGMYDSMLLELGKAIKQLQADGHRPIIQSLVWIQGESDAQTKEMADEYEARLRRMIEHFREVVATDEDLPIILGVDEQHPWVAKRNPQIVEAQKRLAEEDDRIVFTSMIGLEKADSTHLTPSGLAAHGRLLFSAFQKEILD